ncbi:MAG: exosortase H [bacterium]|nr:exosortase H [bacterium]
MNTAANQPRGDPVRTRVVGRFVLAFVAACVVLFALSSTGTARRGVHDPLCRFTASTARPLLSLVGDASVAGRRLVFDGDGAVIGEACNGVVPALIYLSAVLAFPSRWRDKLKGLALGIPAIFVINLVRVVTLMMLQAHRPEILDQVHIYVWQALVIALSMAVWVYWVERFTGERTAARG